MRSPSSFIEISTMIYHGGDLSGDLIYHGGRMVVQETLTALAVYIISTGCYGIGIWHDKHTVYCVNLSSRYY
ncbi:MAG: hypothetical protein ABH870_08075, partial [bacterium]